ncbi:unnamed protein product [Leptidea sinapis]|nr:unnamed protein product [Leptidea sinapis]
MPVRRA